jgi:hypothetical protein
MAEPTTIALTRNGPPPLKRADIPDERDVSRETSLSIKKRRRHLHLRLLLFWLAKRKGGVKKCFSHPVTSH